MSAKEMHEKYEQMLSTYDLSESMLQEFESILREEMKTYQAEPRGKKEVEETDDRG